MLDMVVRTLGLALLHFVWQGVLIGACAAGALRSTAVRTARHRYVVCLLGLIACVLAPLLTASILWKPADAPSGVAAAHVISVVGQRESGLVDVSSMAARGGALSAGGGLDLMLASVALWFLGALTVALYYAIQWVEVERIRRSAVPLSQPANLASITTRVLSRWKAAAAVPVMVSYAVASPIVLGLWRPVVIFPAATIARMPVSDFELILLHEIAHIVRRDAWVNTLQVMLEILLYYHPAVHWLSRRARLERECACDDFAVSACGSAYDYAQALTSLALTHRGSTALSLGAAGADLLPRLRNLAGECTENDSSPRSPALFFLLGLVLVLIVWTGTSPEQLRGWSHSPRVTFAGPRPFARSGGAEAAGTRRAAAAHTVERRSQPDAVPDDFAVAPARQPDRARGARRAPLPAVLAGLPADAAASSHRMEGSAAHAVVAVREPATPTAAVDNTKMGDSSSSEVEPDHANQTGAAPGPDSMPIYAPAPEYPLRARLDGVEGSVLFEVRIGPDGKPTGLRILEANPLGVFEGAVRRTVMKWRYDVPGPTSSPAELTRAYRLNFTLAGISTTAAPLCASSTVSRTCPLQ